MIKLMMTVSLLGLIGCSGVPVKKISSELPKSKNTTRIYIYNLKGSDVKTRIKTRLDSQLIRPGEYTYIDLDVNKKDWIKVTSAKVTNFNSKDRRMTETIILKLNNLAEYERKMYLRSRWRSFAEFLKKNQAKLRCLSMYCPTEATGLGPNVQRLDTYDLILDHKFAAKEIKSNTLVLNKVVPKS